MPYKKPEIYISGLVASLLLFLALLAVQFDNVFFNSSFQTAAVNKLSIYERIISPSDRSLLKSTDTPLESAVKNSITPDLFDKNVKSLIDGLIDFVSGRAKNLPDLYIAGADKLSIATSAGITPAAVEKINLQLVMMFSSKQNYNDILSVISLVQFILKYLPVFLLLLLAAVVNAILRRNSSEIIDWMHVVLLSYFILCWFAALLISLTPWLIPFSRLSGLPEYTVTGILSDYIRYCSGTISLGILLSGLALLAGMRFADFLCGRLNECNETGGLTNSSLDLNLRFVRHETGSIWNRTRLTTFQDRSKTAQTCFLPIRARSMPVKPRSIRFQGRAIPKLLAVTAIYSILAFALANNIDTMFHKRNLGQAVSYIIGNLSYNCYTDARNEDVCLLNIKLLNENDKTPVRNMQAAIYPLDSESRGKAISDKEATPEKADEYGSVSFLLSEGEFRLELYPSDLSGYRGQTVSDPLSYDLSLSSPGRIDLAITLGSDANESSEPDKTSSTDKSNDTAKSSGASNSSEPAKSGEPDNPNEPDKSNEPVNSSEPAKSGGPDNPNEPSTTSVPVIPRLKIVDASMQYMP